MQMKWWGWGKIFLLCSAGALVGAGDDPAWWCGFLWGSAPIIWTVLRANCVLYVILGDIGSLTWVKGRNASSRR